VIFLLVSVFAFSQFGEPNLINHSNVIGSITKIIVLDFDYDGDEDMLVSSYAYLNSTVVFIENLGGEIFANQKMITGNSFWEIDTADIDNDGLTDLLAQNDSGIVWYKNHGNNSFNEFHLISSSYGCAYANDIDQDGDSDVFIVHYNEGRIAWRENLGSGILGDEELIDGSTYYPNTIQFADMDNDGDTDLISASNPYFVIDIYENDGNTSFSKVPVINNFENAIFTIAPIIRDVTGDGYKDILYCMGSLNIFRNLGNCEFAEPDFYFNPGFMNNVISAKDINSDEDLDYAYTCTFLDEELKITISGNDDITIILGEDSYVSFILFSDINGDGHEDIIAGRNDGQIFIIKNSGDDSFDIPFSINSECVIPEINFLVDYDNDNDLDLLTLYSHSQKLSLYENLLDGVFGDEQIILDSISNFYNSSGGEMCDLDNDGDLDLVYGGDNHINIKLNNVSYWSEYSIASAWSSTPDLFDYNADGYTDLLFFNNFAVNLALNDGEGVFQQPTPIANLSSSYNDIKVCDIDNDNDLDLITYSSDYKINLLLNDGTNQYPNSVVISAVSSGGDNNSLLIFDYNNDNRKDILVRSGFKILLFENIDGQVFDMFVLVDNSYDYTVSALITYDIDADLDQDIIYADETGVYWLENESGLSFEGPININNYIYVQDLDVADVDNDGSSDLITFDKNTRKIFWQKNFYNYYRISGQIYFDENQNGIREEEEPGFLQTQLNVNPNSLATYSNSEGEYWIAVDPGSYQLTCAIPQYWALSTNPQTYMVTLAENTPQPDTCNFGFYPSEIVNVIVPDLIPAFSICNDAAMFWVNLYNCGTTIPAGVVEVVLDPAYTFEYSEIPVDSIIGTSVYFSFDSIPFFQDLGFYFMTTAPPSSMMGDTVSNFLNVLILDEFGYIQTTFTDTLSELVTCSYDPNDKSVFPRGIGSESFIEPDQELEYTIRFQNTGNDTAINVTITDPLNTNLDQNSFEFLSSSHDVRILRQDRLLTFVFDSIMLPDSNVNAIESNGYVKYKIRPNPSLNPFVEIINTGYIYFDFNDPVITNTVLSTIFCWISPPIPIVSQTEGTLYTDAIGAIQWFFNGEAVVGANTGNYTPGASGIVSVEVINIYGCSQLSEPFDFIYNKLDMASREFAIFPNPAADRLNIISDLNGTIVIYSITGNILLTKDFKGNEQIDISMLMKGTYLVRVEGINSSSFVKLVVIK
jgi:uncharacterized repeat protein (TIGR01451 family)